MFLNKNLIDLENGNYTFNDYFKMNISPTKLVEVFNYKFEINNLGFKDIVLEDDLKSWVNTFNTKFLTLKKNVNFSNEVSKREFLISPIITELVHNYNIKVDTETDVYFDNILKGKIDYILNNNKNIFIAIEAKNADMDKGLNQLIVELIALDKIIDNGTDFLYGAVTIGFDWSFVILDRNEKIITQNLHTLHIDNQLEDIVKILVSILK
jgi:hypothetical protein